MFRKRGTEVVVEVFESPYSDGEPFVTARAVRVPGSDERLRSRLEEEAKAGVQPVYLDNMILTGTYNGPLTQQGVRVSCRPGRW